jgi:hypothetical protein
MEESARALRLQAYSAVANLADAAVERAKVMKSLALVLEHAEFGTDYESRLMDDLQDRIVRQRSAWTTFLPYRQFVPFAADLESLQLSRDLGDLDLSAVLNSPDRRVIAPQILEHGSALLYRAAGLMRKNNEWISEQVQ